MNFSDDAALGIAPAAFPFPDEPEEGQRWSTWPATIPTQRGPKPYPDWVVTAAGAIDTELGIIKTGKEADVFLIERAVPGDASQHSILAAKRYRSSETSNFHRSAQYTEGRRLRRTLDTRAVARKTAYGRSVQAGQWAVAEFAALSTMYEAGLPVPYPVQVLGTEILMEFMGDPVTGTAAPRLAQIRDSGEELSSCFEQVADIMRRLARAGTAHGDMSAYNLLVDDGRVVMIDLPQLVDLASNPSGLDLLYRDCSNICDWFVRRGLPVDRDALFAELVAEVY